MKYILGIDPGINGGFALLNPALELEDFGALPNKTKDLFAIIKSCYSLADEQIEVNIERPFLAQASNDTIYINYGRILAVLDLLEIPYTEIRSQQWLKQLNLKKLTKKDKPSTRYIPELYPNLDFSKPRKVKSKRPLVIHDGITDSVCIALFQSQKNQ